MEKLPGLARSHPQIAALVLGGLSALGFQPFHLWPVGLAAVGAFGWLAWRAPGWRSALLAGGLFGLAHFTITNNWIATAFTYQAEMPAILGWAAAPLLSLYLAIWPALATCVAWCAARRRGLLTFALVFGAMWIGAEWLRSWVFSGYAWGPFSMMLLGPWDRQGLALALPYTGSYALSGIVVCLAVLLGCDGREASNRAQWCHQPFEDLIQQAKVLPTQEERQPLYEEAQVIFKEQAPWATIAHSVVYMPMRPEVEGYVVHPLGGHIFNQVGLSQ